MSTTPSTQQSFPRPVRVIEHQRITMPDGCTLSAKIWLPDDAESNPVPVILEHLPYRKRDGTIARDSLNHSWFAKHGYACIRVDMRGNGDSEGLMDDEYTEQELQDACSVISWATEQSWCSGTVGMMGISWGGFNALQVASLRPPALKAIITVCSTVDRFADDIHFKGGCLLGENIGWSATMLSYSSRPPDPLLVGEQWRTLWLNRLENMPFLAKPWLGHQRRDDYWKHGSVCEDYSAIQAAVLSIGGWHDGYRNTISHLVENLQAPVKGIVGPWIHKYPNIAEPKPQIGFLQEALRWWDHWLKDIDTGVEKDPDYRAYLMGSIKPAPWYDERPGRWIAEQQWPSPTINNQCFSAVVSASGKGTLITQSTNTNTNTNTNSNSNIDTSTGIDIDTGTGTGTGTGTSNIQFDYPVNIDSPLQCGAKTGEFFPFTYGPELPDNQHEDDQFSTCFDSEPLAEAIDIVGACTVDFRFSANKSLAFVAVRVCDVFPDGSSALISLGILNLTHTESPEHPNRLVPGNFLNANLALDQIAYHLPAGHKLRLAFSNNYWPFIWPSPEHTVITLSSAMLSIPVRPIVSDSDECTFEPVENAESWHHKVLRPTSSTRELTTDQATGNINTFIHNDFGENLNLDHLLATGSEVSEHWSIHPDDPLSASVDIEWQQSLSRDNWHVHTIATVHLRGDKDWFYITGTLSATENGNKVFERRYEEKIERQFV